MCFRNGKKNPPTNVSTSSIHLVLLELGVPQNKFICRFTQYTVKLEWDNFLCIYIMYIIFINKVKESVKLYILYTIYMLSYKTQEMTVVWPEEIVVHAWHTMRVYSAVYLLYCIYKYTYIFLTYLYYYISKHIIHTNFCIFIPPTYSYFRIKKK